MSRLFLSLSIICNLTVVFSLHAQSTIIQSNSKEKKLFILSFLCSTDSSNYSDIQAQIPDLIKLGLRENQLITVINNNSRKYDNKNIRTERTNNGFDISNDSLKKDYDKKGICFVLKGSLLEINKEIQIKASLWNIPAGKIISVESEWFNHTDFFSALGSFCKQLNANLELLTTDKTKISLGNFSHERASSFDVLLFREYLTGDLSTLDNQNYFFINNNKNKRYDSITDDLPADILIEGKLFKKQANYFVDLKLYFTKYHKEISLPFKSEKNTVSDLELSVFDYLKKSLNYLAVMDTSFIKILLDGDATNQNYLSNAKTINDSVYFLKSFLLSKELIKNPKSFDALYLFGQLNYNAGMYPEAIEHFEKAKKISSDNFELLLELGDAYYQIYDYSKSNKIFSALLKNAKNKPEYYQGLAYASWRSGKLSDAAKYYKLNLDSSKTKTDSVQAYLLWGDFYYMRYIDDSAQVCYENSLRLGSNSLQLRKNLSDLYVTIGRQAQNKKDTAITLEYFSKAALTFPNGSTYDALKSYYINNMLLDKAERLIVKGVKDSIYKPDKVYYEYANELMLFGEDSLHDFSIRSKILTEAIKYLKIHDHQSQVPDDNLQNDIGTCYFFMKQYDSTEIYYKKAISIYANEPVYFLNLAEVQLVQYKPLEVPKTLNNIPTDKISDESKMISHYLKICAYKMSPGNNASLYLQEKKKLDDFFERKNQVSSKWSFDGFLAWVNTTKKLDDSTKKFINDLTAEVIGHQSK